MGKKIQENRSVTSLSCQIARQTCEPLPIISSPVASRRPTVRDVTAEWTLAPGDGELVSFPVWRRAKGDGAGMTQNSGEEFDKEWTGALTDQSERPF
jgi:hypothetical protein